ncbi:hypothetical protein HRE94_12540 [Enterococcus faecalis]|uniref:hypothetical protein n=1 Tax=Enterococcus faecalis TaxID=1351 RepID=UPI00032D99AF|nr:hypothetical protein [Enterococcus faecalis]EOJ89071.1 hypothetical protein WOG_02731 [Enterococcus faecalis EnGen0370]MBJ0413852.1 hypothetical protein [Enterococcus faecalis]MBJ0416852.1 hypothetical protein [Enterococcus faecalis]NRC83711.1 hypothetical protein [Enterococcus faecalis]NSQ42112.1 hypothetical protein [Enterococcus faecalis]
MNENLKEVVNKILEFEPDTPLESIKQEIGQLADAILFPEQSTVKSVLQEMYEINQAEGITTDGKPITVADYQDLIYQYIEQLSDLLGIELED